MPPAREPLRNTFSDLDEGHDDNDSVTYAPFGERFVSADPVSNDAGETQPLNIGLPQGPAAAGGVADGVSAREEGVNGTEDGEVPPAISIDEGDIDHQTPITVRDRSLEAARVSFGLKPKKELKDAGHQRNNDAAEGWRTMDVAKVISNFIIQTILLRERLY